MKDYTYNGVPVAQMSNEQIRACLEDGVEINDSDGRSDPVGRVMKRLHLEVEIRKQGLRS